MSKHDFRPENSFQRSAGILLHPTSLPGPFGIGDFGRGAHTFLKFLTRAGVGYWQMLPLVPAGPGASPYSSWASMAFHPLLVDVEFLKRAGLLSQSDLDEVTRTFATRDVDFVDYGAVESAKRPLLRQAAEHLRQKAHPLRDAKSQFVDENSWVHDVARFAVARTKSNGPWWKFPAEFRRREPAALKRFDVENKPAIDDEIAIQFFCDLQWRMLRVQCKDWGIRLIGDVPIYVDLDSVDVWANQSAFLLDDDHQPTSLSGVPPDAFSATGQLWGNPLYDWPAMADDGFRFFVEKMRRAFSLYDVVRIDHFRGFAAYWSVPRGATTAKEGEWREGPGARLFDVLRDTFGTLPIIAEDLGVIDDDVVTLREHIGLPGMKILQFAFGEDASHAYLTHNHSTNSVVYTGTHDSNTTLGWWQSIPEPERDHVRRYLGVSGHDVVWDLNREALRSTAHTAILPMQDLLSLDGGARMNTPGVADGNWRWRVRKAAFNDELADRLHDLIGLYDRDDLRRLHKAAKRDARAKSSHR